MGSQREADSWLWIVGSAAMPSQRSRQSQVDLTSDRVARFPA